MTLTQLILACICLLCLASAAVADECAETITIDSTEYQLNDYWCGRALDTVDIAEPAGLVRLPQELTFEDYRIYVLPQTRQAFVAMAEAAKKDSVELIADSGFRSLSFQRRIIRRRLEKGDSFQEILESVAPPGYSEHHTGRALDLCPSEARFAYGKAYRWLSENGAEFGFYETYPEAPMAGAQGRVQSLAKDSSPTKTDPEETSVPVQAVPGWESWHWTYRGD